MTFTQRAVLAHEFDAILARHRMSTVLVSLLAAMLRQWRTRPPPGGPGVLSPHLLRDIGLHEPHLPD